MALNAIQEIRSASRRDYPSSIAAEASSSSPPVLFASSRRPQYLDPPGDVGMVPR
jgi:hypothetical protein